MQKFLNWLDDIAKIEVENAFAKWLERIAFIFLILMILSAPHSIAATQTAWLCGMLAWIIRFFIKPRPPLSKNPLRLKTPLDIALWAFLFWSLISSIFSYAPDISLDRLRNTLLFLIFYFVIGNLRSIRAAKFLAFALIFSAMVSVIWTPIERIFGRGVEVTGVSAESPLAKGAVIQGLAIADGDTIIEVNKRKIRTPESLIAELEKSDVSQVKYYRPDFNSVVEVRRADLLDGENAAQLETQPKLAFRRILRALHDFCRSPAAYCFAHFRTFYRARQKTLTAWRNFAFLRCRNRCCASFNRYPCIATRVFGFGFRHCSGKRQS
jgi:hypothetical protein